MAPLHPLTPTAQAAHAFLRPSAAHRWVHCSGSAWLESQFPDLSDEEPRRTGTAAHWALECTLKLVPVKEGDVAPNGVVVDTAMMQAAEMTSAHIERTLRPYYGDQWRLALVIESRVAIPSVNPQNWGTPDLRAWTVTAGGRFRLFLLDYKYGFRAVEAFENWQLLDYASGCMSEGATVFPLFRADLCDIDMHVVQPRAYHGEGPIRSWQLTGDKLASYTEKLVMAAEEATGPNPQCRPRADLCNDCLARSGCTAVQTLAYGGMDLAYQAVPRVLSDEAMGLELSLLTDAAAILKARISGLEEVVKSRIKAGARVNHWTFGPGQGKTVWIRPEAEVIAMGEMMGVKLAKPAEAITPTQAKDLGLLPESLLATYSERRAGATKLTRMDDSAARRIFSAPL